MPDLDQQIGAAVRSARLKRGVTQSGVAQQLGVDRSTIAKYEAGVRGIPAATLVQLAQILDLSPAWLLPGASVHTQQVLQILDARPELAAPVLVLLEALLQDHGEAEELRR